MGGMKQTDNSKCRLKIWAKGLRPTFRKTRLLIIFGYCNQNPCYSIRRSGFLPHVIEDEPDRGYIEFSSFTFNFWYFGLIIRKLRKWRD